MDFAVETSSTFQLQHSWTSEEFIEFGSTLKTLAWKKHESLLCNEDRGSPINGFGSAES